MMISVLYHRSSNFYMGSLESPTSFSEINVMQPTMEGSEDFSVPWGLENLSDRSFVLCLDGCYGAGDFVWTSLMLSLTRSERPVVLISANHGPEHWECLLRKNGDMRRKGFMDRFFIKYLVPEGGNTISDEECRRIKESSFPCDHSTWSELVKWQAAGMPIPSSASAKTEQEQVHEEAEKGGSTGTGAGAGAGAGAKHAAVSLFIDDLSAVELLAPSPASARFFLNCLLRELYHSQNQNQSQSQNQHTTDIFSVVALGPSSSSSSSDWDSDEPSLTEICKTRANVTVTVAPLTSGYSLDIHGTVHITAITADQNTSTSTGSGGRVLLEEARSFKLVRPSTIVSHRLAAVR